MQSVDATFSELLAAYQLQPPAQTFALPSGNTNHSTLGLRTASGEYVLKSYRATMNAPSLEYEHALLGRLARAGLTFAVPAPIPARDGSSMVRLQDAWAVLTPFAQGRGLEFRLTDGARPSDALAQAEVYGAAVGELHVALANEPPLHRPGRNLFDALFDFPPPDRAPLALKPVYAGFADRSPYRELFAWWRAEVAELKAFVDGPYQELPRQVCHNDVSPANVLVENGRVSAVLDWEFATVAPRALDVAMGLRLVMQVPDDVAPWKYVRRFARGYARHTRLSDAELAALPALLRLRNTIPGLWWLGGGGATSADPHHFQRRILAMQQLTHWLRDNGERLKDTFTGSNEH